VELDAAAEVELEGGVVDRAPRFGETWGELAGWIAFEQVVEEVVVDGQPGGRVGEVGVEALQVAVEVDGEGAGQRGRGGGGRGRG
jgi:hypothetical protein